MVNPIFIYYYQGNHYTGIDKKHYIFIDIHKISAVTCPSDGMFSIELDNGTLIYEIPIEEFEYVMRNWVPHYKELEKYKEYISKN